MLAVRRCGSCTGGRVGGETCAQALDMCDMYISVTVSWDAAAAQDYLAHIDSTRNHVRNALVLRGVCEVTPSAPQRILDVGDGTARVAIGLAERGHDVTVVDIDQHVLDVGRQELATAGELPGKVTLLAGSAEQLDQCVDGLFDVTCCHGVLPFVDDMAGLCQGLAAVTTPGGWVSVVSLNAQGLALTSGLSSLWDEVHAILRARETSGPRVLAPATTIRPRVWADYVPYVEAALAGAQIAVDTWRGIRVYTERRYDPADGLVENIEDIAELEWLAGAESPTRDIAGLFHLLGRHLPAGRTGLGATYR